VSGSEGIKIDMEIKLTAAFRKFSEGKLAFAFAILLGTCLSVSAKPTTFKNSGLKIETVITLDVEGKRVTGTFASSEYGENPVTETFMGEVVPTPKGKSGVYMQIHFSGKVPYNPPAHAKVLRWALRIVSHRARLYIPMEERSYTGKTPRWVVSDVELTPED
jgi:hypothetical protein